MKYILLLPLALVPWCFSAQSLFTKITDAANPEANFPNTPATYKGAVWIDLDDDNWPDLFASQYFLFRNNHDGSFTQLPNLSGAVLGQNAAGSSWGDLDNDGHPDCVSAGLVSGLHHNNGDNTFTLLNASLPNFSNYSAWDAALADVDNNGRLDLTFTHACCSFHPTGPFPCRLYLQATDGSFSQITGYEFTDQNKPYTIPTWSDYDLDGDMDLFIGSGPAGSLGPDFCYKNLLKENGTFSLVRLSAAPFDALQNGQTYNFPDFDNDGDLDMCLTNYSGIASHLWRNEGGGNYTPMSTPFTTDDGFLANTWGDLDNDGDLDVLISLDGNTTVRCFRNLGNGTFSALENAGTAGQGICGIALADYDNDGDLDFFTNGSATARALFRNDNLGAGNHWAQFTLQGMASNRSAIGAILRVKASINGVPIWQIRELQAHNSFQSQNDLRQHFGLGNATGIDSIEVRWPSGLVEQFAGQARDNFYKIVEGQGISLITSSNEPSSVVAFNISPNPVKTQFRITASAVKTVEVFDSTGKLIPLRTRVTTEGAEVQLPASLPSGAWLVRVGFADGKSATRPFVKI